MGCVGREETFGTGGVVARVGEQGRERMLLLLPFAETHRLILFPADGENKAHASQTWVGLGWMWGGMEWEREKGSDERREIQLGDRNAHQHVFGTLDNTTVGWFLLGRTAP